MKLLTRTSLNFISISAIFFLLGSVMMYFSVKNIIRENLKEQLLIEKREFIHAADTDRFYNSFNLIYFDSIQKNIETSFSDSVLIVDDRYILYSKIEFSYLDEGQYYRVGLLKSKNQSDLLIMKIVIMNIGFAMLFFLIIFFVNRHSISSALKVFYSTISKIEDFQVNKHQVLTLDVAEVEEVKQLNHVFEKMSQQIRNDFDIQKEYTENITHELQTPLSVISTKVDELMQADNISKEQMEHLSLLMETTNRLSRINKSLIFLTKIDNRFYSDKTKISLNSLLRKALNGVQDVIKDKGIHLDVKYIEESYIYMDEYLAETVLLNLLKNAIIHNIDKGDIEVSLFSKSLIISNTGPEISFPESDIFKRFTRNKSTQNSLGIGLSIVKRICDLYDINIDYKFAKRHIFTIKL